MKIRSAFLFLTIITAFTVVRAEKLSQGALSGSVGVLEFLEDTGSTLTLADMESQTKFRPSEKRDPNFGFSKSSYWFRFRVPALGAGGAWLLELGYPPLDLFEVYIPVQTTQGITYVKKKTGDSVAPDEKEVIYRNHTIRIPENFAPGAFFYGRLQTTSSAQLPLRLWDAADFGAKVNTENYVFGLFLGIFVVMAAYNFFLYMSIREPAYITYVAYIAAFLLLQLALNGLAAEYFWPSSIWWINRSVPFSVAACLFTASLFTVQFLDLRRNAPRIYKAMLVLMFLDGLGMGGAFLVEYRLSIIASVLFGLPTAVLVIASGILVWARGYKPARYFVIAWITMAAATVLLDLKSLGMLPDNLLTKHGQLLGAALEVVLLSFALGDRINAIRREKEDAQSERLEYQRLVTNSMERFVPRKFLDILGSADILNTKLGEQAQKHMTVLFADIRSFTSLSEQMSPEENFNFINAYFSRMGPVIREHGGFVDKYIGDAMMALFSSEPHNAVRAAVAMQDKVNEYNRHRRNSGYEPIRIGIGIQDGEVMLGTIGEPERVEGTVISDTVNLAARFEKLTKTFGARILAGGSVFGEGAESIDRRFVGRIKVRGREKGADIFEVIHSDPEGIREIKLSTKAAFEDGVNHYFAREYQKARNRFNAVLTENPTDRIAEIYLRKSEELMHDVVLNPAADAF